MKLLGIAMENMAKLKNLIILALFILVAVLLLLPIVRVSDPSSGKTAWLYTHDLTALGITDDEAGPDPEFGFYFTFALAVAGVIISGLSFRKASKGRLVLRIFTTVIGGLVLFINLYTFPTHTEIYPVKLSPWMWPCFFIFILISIIDIRSLMTWRQLAK